MIVLITECDGSADFSSVYQYMIDTEDIPTRFAVMLCSLQNNTTLIEPTLEHFLKTSDLGEFSSMLHKKICRSNMDKITIDKFITIEV